MGEYLAEKNYWGFGPAFLDGRGYRKRGTRPSAVSESEDFSKSLSGEGEFYIDEFGIKRKRKVMPGRELQNIDVEEISL